MARRRIGEPEPEFAPLLAGIAHVSIPEDKFELEHMEFVQNHPVFPDALDRLREDLGFGANREWSPYLIRAAIADPDAMDYPARRFARAWGLTVAAVYYLALKDWTPVETDSFAVQATPLEYIIRIPRPLTPSRRQALVTWLGSTTAKEPGTAEEIWGRAGKQRHDLSPGAVAAIPWFKRWNEGEEPATIYRDVMAEEKLDFEKFHKRLVAAWERMRRISPDGVREARPSKVPT